MHASDLTSLDDRLRGHVVGPDHPEYETARRVWNGMVDKRPAVVVRGVDPGDVTEAIAFAREHELVSRCAAAGTAWAASRPATTDW